MREIWVPSLGQEYPLEKEMADYSPWGCTESDTTERLTHTLSLLLQRVAFTSWWLGLLQGTGSACTGFRSRS